MTSLSRTRSPISVVLLFALATLAAIWPELSRASTDEYFNVLQVGTHTYKNVTVTTRAKDYIFILHSGGMGNIKVAELPDDVRQKLGYVAKKKPTDTAQNWVANSAAGQVIGREIRKAIDPKQARQQIQLFLSPTLVVAIAGVLLIFYLFYSYCAMLICEKAGHPAGILVWLPLVQVIPMLRAAGMSPLWFVGFLVPVLNVITHLVWSLKIVRARGKSGWVGLCMILPITNVLAFLYLAFSGSGGEKKTSLPRPQIMTLETA